MPTVRPSTSKKLLASSLALITGLGPVFPAAAQSSASSQPIYSHTSDDNTASPIKHVIVIVGENRSFDHVFATYKPKAGETVNNLLSEGIVKADGTPGAHFAQALQNNATVTGSTTYEPSPSTKAPYTVLPAPLAGGPTDPCKTNGMCTIGDALSSEDGLPKPPAPYYQSLLEGGTGLPNGTPDSRITGVHNSAPYSTLPSGPFQLTNGTTFPYNAYAASPVHRYYQMRQELDCSAANATPENPSGCLADLFPWTETTVGAGANGIPQPPTFCPDYAPGCITTGEGSSAMGFYNMQAGDAPYTKFLADNYAFSDNYHQPAMGGTGLDSIMLFFADALWFKDQNGNTTPPENAMTFRGGPVNEIENPNPQPGTNNWYTEDGYGSFTSTGNAFGGGSYSNCSDPSAPGIKPVLDYLASLKPAVKSNCQAGHYYLLNNYNPGYFGNGADAYTDTNPHNTPFTIPPTSQRSIGDVLLDNHISWKSYNDQWDTYLTDPYQLNSGKIGKQSDDYCNICNGFQYQTQIMTNASVRTTHITDTDQLYQDIKSGQLPAVSFVKPSGWVDGHPGSSKWDLFEGFVKKIVTDVHDNPELWRSTAIFVTVDEGGGYYDSGYVQPLDFFGDGTRIPLIVVSPYTKPGHISHNYADHVSVLKFIERNWNLPTISNRSRDNLPNPVYNPSVSRYAPTNGPAISDLFDLFDFNRFAY